MNYYFLCNEFFKQYEITGDIQKAIQNYIRINYDILNKIYFNPKKIDNNQVEKILNTKEYKEILLNTILNLKTIDLNKTFKNVINELGEILNYKNINKNVYIIIGFNTTTIYSTRYKNEDITVILLEATLGLEENIKMLLAHEYTHWIREKEIKHNIFEYCIGERFATEGIACNFSEEIVPNNTESYYTIVSNETVKWVKDNIFLIDEIVKEKLNNKDMMYDFFYMFAKTKIPNMPVRTGYVYGYLKVKDYMRKNNLKVKDIIKINWEDILINNFYIECDIK